MVELCFNLALAQQQPSQGGDGNLALWGLLCIAVAVVLLILELFVPSGLILGTTAMICLVTGIVLLFIENQTLGLVAAIVSMVSVPVFFAIAVRLWPQTPIARLLTLGTTQIPGAQTPGIGEADGGEGRPTVTVGDVGRAVTDLRPVGTVMIDGRRLDGLAESGVIRAGTTVKVVSVDGIQVKVREES